MRTLLYAAISLLLSCTGALTQNTPHMWVGERMSAPGAWSYFCYQYRSECERPLMTPATILMNHDVMKQIRAINVQVNRTIESMTDALHWGSYEQWNFGEDGYGDCDDYVLRKKRELIAAGYPRSALLFTTVTDGNGDGHAILTIVTDKGDFILDNANDEVKPWYYSGYWLWYRQSQTDPNGWYSLRSTMLGAVKK